MDPYINLQEDHGDCETSCTRRYMCKRVKETAKFHGPVDKFAGGSKRPRHLMDPKIRLKEFLKETPTPHGPVYYFDGGSKGPRNLMEREMNLKGDLETSWTR